MDTQTDSVTRAPKPTVPNSAPAPKAPAPAHRAAEVIEAPDPSALRLKRIADYQTAALENAQPRIGLLGGITADLARLELRMSQARRALDWDAMLTLALDPARATKLVDRDERGPTGGCSMCGEFCSVRTMDECDVPDNQAASDDR